MKQFLFEEKILRACPKINLLAIESDVCMQKDNPLLWEKINAKTNHIASSLNIEDISKTPTIASARKAYKACGKDPARYRLSSEALLRRVVSGKGLYQINNVVDLLNLVSVSTGFSIGGYDADKIQGGISLGIGQSGEPYCGLGRGELNIDGMPVFRDENGAFGTSTSDSERTGVSLQTTRFLMVIVDYGGDPGLKEAGEMARSLLKEFACAQNIESKQISNTNENHL